jgi:hypothetical protein
MEHLKLLVTDNDMWSAGEGGNDGTPFILRFRPYLQDFIATGQYNKHFIITWPYDSNNTSLMPDEAELELMTAVEDALVNIFEHDVQCVLAFVYTGQNQKDWHWYSNNIEETGNRLNTALAEFDELPIELSSEDDPDWTEYNAVLAGTEGATEDTEEE